MPLPEYDPNTTYLVFQPNAFAYTTGSAPNTVRDDSGYQTGNIYELDNNFPYDSISNPYYTYSNNGTLNYTIYPTGQTGNTGGFLISGGGGSNTNPCSNVYQIVFGSNVTTIPDYALQKCTFLTTLIFNTSDNFKIIGKYAFYNIYSIKSLTIPNSVTTIGDSAFSYCSNLKTITTGNGLTNISNNAFQNISSTIFLNWSSEYVAKYFYTNTTNNGGVYNVAYNPKYPPTSTLGATCTLTSSGVDPDTGTVVTASSSATATTSGNRPKDALKALLEDVTKKLLLEGAVNFSTRNKNATYTLSITLDS